VERQKLDLLLFKTQQAGWSVRTRSAVKKGTYITNYCGLRETIDESLADDNESADYDDEYKFSVDVSHKKKKEENRNLKDMSDNNVVCECYLLVTVYLSICFCSQVAFIQWILKKS
jgi:SET domain-containing protein